MDISEIAKRLDAAAKNAEAISQISQEEEYSLAQAYKIQRQSIDYRLQRGEQFVGVKMGFTSKAKMEQMGVHDLIWGRLTNAMQIQNSGSMDFSRFIHPRVEPELCFRLNQDLERELNMEELPDYFDQVAPALEVIDSRYQNFKFSLEDVVADNCSSSGFALGAWQQARADLKGLHLRMTINGKLEQEGSASNILDDPWASVQIATRISVEQGQKLEAGALVLAGAATSAVFLKEGDAVELEIPDFGSCGFSVV